MKKNKIIYLITILVVITITFGTIYFTQQQSLRIGANNPQIQIAQDAANSLNNGINPITFADSRIDIGKSLSPFIIIYSKSGRVVSGNGYLNNEIATAPIGVLQHSDGKDYSFVTWQPQSNVRIASVSVSANKYYVLSGRSLKEVEKQEQSQLEFAILGWASSIIVTVAGFALAKRVHKKHFKEKDD